MSNNNNTNTVPVINPDAYPQLLEMLKDSLRRHTDELKLAEAMLDRIEEDGISVFSREEDEMVTSALLLLVAKKEEDIAVTEIGIAEFEAAID